MSTFRTSWLTALVVGTVTGCGGGGAPTNGNPTGPVEAEPAQHFTASAVVTSRDSINTSANSSPLSPNRAPGRAAQTSAPQGFFAKFLAMLGFGKR